MKEVNRESDYFQADEELADVLFEYGFFYFQTADYVFLPYRRFNKDSFLKRPSWLYFQEHLLDMSFNAFLHTGTLKNAVDNDLNLNKFKEE